MKSTIIFCLLVVAASVPSLGQAQSQVSLAKDDGVAGAMPGDTIIYTLTMFNSGINTEPNLVLNETVPANTTFNAASSSAGWVCTGSDCTLNVGGLSGNGFSTSRTFAVDVDDPVPVGVFTITNTATIDASIDNFPSDDTATETTSLTGTPVELMEFSVN